VFREWLLAEAEAYCMQMPQLRQDETASA